MDTWTLRWCLLLEFLLNLATLHVTWAQTTEDASRTWSRPEPAGPGGQCPRGCEQQARHQQGQQRDPPTYTRTVKSLEGQVSPHPRRVMGSWLGGPWTDVTW